MKKKKPNPELIDEDTLPWTKEQFRTAISGKDFFYQQLGKEKAEAFFAESRAIAAARKAGRPKKEHPKKQITVRIDDDILTALKKRGRGWQTLMNSALRDWVVKHPL